MNFTEKKNINEAFEAIRDAKSYNDFKINKN